MLSVRKNHVLVDLCTQRDYLSPEGARPASNAEIAAHNIKHLMALARWAKFPTISCVDIHRLNDVHGTPGPTCIDGTPGQRKLSCTLLPNRVLIDSDNCLCVPLDLLDRYQQVIFTKDHRDPFTNPKLDRLLTEAPARGYIVFGVGMEASLRLLVLGLLLRGRRVTLIHDAAGYWNEADSVMTVRQLEAKGCQLMTTRELIDSTVQVERLQRAHRAIRPRSVA